MDRGSWTRFVVCSIGFLVALINCEDDQSNDDEKQQLSVSLLNQLTAADPRIRPGIFGNATKVQIDFFVQSFGPLNEMEMEFAVDLDFRSTWVDPRLRYIPPPGKDKNNTVIYIPEHSVNKFWIPDMYFPNEKSGAIHQITIPNKSLRIHPNGTVRYFSRFGMRVACTMYLRKYPLDHQLCHLKISTYSYDENEVVLEWFDDEPIEMKNDTKLPQFDFVGNPTHGSCTEAYKTGSFSCLMASFHLKRRPGFFILQSFIPSILIVMLSWVAFWINKNSEPARIALGVTTVLTMTTQLTSAANTAMRVSYPKALDVWYAACMMFVFGAILEYAFVNVCSRSEKKHADNDKKAEGDVEKTEGTMDRDLEWLRQKLVGCNVSAKNIDRLSRRAFPIAFIIFNFFYWIIYTNISDEGFESFQN